MISVVIRNKNEGEALKYTLQVLTTLYKEDFNEIIIVDNQSEDDSVEVALQYGCKVINITNFTYGRALNLGIEKTTNKLILFLSSHAVPVGNHFFKSAVETFRKNSSIAGVRFINSYENQRRAFQNDFEINDGLNFGLMNACAMINKDVWYQFKFDEALLFSEDKKWSDLVLNNGFVLKDINETFFYFIKRNEQGNVNRWKNETLAHFQLNNKSYPSILRLIFSSLYKIFIKNLILFIKTGVCDLKILKAKLEIKKYLKKS